MKFKCNVSSLLKGVAPVVEVSNRSAVKDFDGANRINIIAKDDELLASAFNGHVAINNVISDRTVDDFEYELLSEGTVTVNAVDLEKILSSFRPKEKILFNVNKSKEGSELVVSVDSDPDEFMKLPCYSSEVVIPKMALKFDSVMVMDRSNLVHAVNKVFFAIGFQDEVEKYKHWKLTATDKKVRLVAGTGARFAIIDMEGDNLISVKPDEVTLLGPKEHTESILKILSGLDDEKVVIKQTSTKSKNPQIVMKAGSLEIIFVEINPNISYPNENKFLQMSFPHKFVTELSDWAYVGKGVSAAFNEDLRKEKKIHAAIVSVDKSRSFVHVKTDDVVKASRKVPIVDSAFDYDNLIQCNCPAPYLKEISDKGQSGRVQLEMSDNSSLPVLIRFYAADTVKQGSLLVNENKSSGITEKFTIFFATMQG